ncbi:tRNA preQ1(34) S-adenosylmethionine ribosyltransferase-isomerase QueA [Christensenellaceae bacterium OttesenSCG-928-L17]|nr:tRNA preQ1(34) S-adenosylmethionine ribosyltransferase-isomerase QueA [Christensenellaceae bacterium OttesenSCG-928-L17]
MRTSDFYYDLPPELIAQTPIEHRDASRLLALNRSTGEFADMHFGEILSLLKPGDVLVRNTTRVIPARLFGVREETGGVMEFLLLKRLPNDQYETLVKPGRRAKTGVTFRISEELTATIVSSTPEGGRIIQMEYDGILEEILDRVGNVPLPPYITTQLLDKERYQTVYAREYGSAAAPTAGLHFTDDLLANIQKKGVMIADILLHVGLGTFRPVSEEHVEDHHMHSEYYEVSEEAAETINDAKKHSGRIIAVGTTSCRTLESVAGEDGKIRSGRGETSIFIMPGYQFKAVDALITNFHLPESTLLMLVSALATREDVLRAYQHAINERYRFFSFGDAMFIY